MVNAMDVSMNMMAHHVVALERNVAAPRGPNAVWLPAPPNAPARSAASPLCSMMTTIKSPQITMCNVTSMKYTFQPSASRPNPTASEIAHFTSLGISFPLLSEIHDGGKGLRIQTCAADQRSVNFHLSHQSLDVIGFDAAAVEDSQPRSALRSKTRRRPPSQEPVRFGGHFRRRRAARANCPNWLVGKNDTRELGAGQRGYAAAELPLKDFLGLAAFPLGEQFADAQNRRQSRPERRFDFFIGALIGLSEELPPFGMSDDYGAASGLDQHRGGYFACERPLGFGVHILSGDR